MPPRDRKIALIGKDVITPFKRIRNGMVIIDGERISYVGPVIDIPSTEKIEVIDASKYHIVPGFIDIHAHGALGCNVMDASIESLRKISEHFARHGVTAFLATTFTAPHERLLSVVKSVHMSVNSVTSGAEILGIHLEGPWLNKEKAGSQPSRWLRLPSKEEFLELYKASNGIIRMVTIAPELKGAIEVIEIARKMGVVPSAGHTLATFECMIAAQKAGLSHITHMFNAMGAFHHRSPGPVGAGLIIDDLTADVIVDGVHVHPSVVKLLIRVKGVDKICLITDSTSFSGLKPGEYKIFGDTKVIVERGACWLPNGRLFGSVLTMDDAVRNVIKFAGIPLEDAIRMASYNPARILNMSQEMGSLTVGKVANITIIDNNICVKLTIVRGNIVFRSDSI
ncbi:MAG: N-acetylglucosamine-6-phosphate deacetylase [Candidatus Baldrarchaeia archaeon]